MLIPMSDKKFRVVWVDLPDPAAAESVYQLSLANGFAVTHAHGLDNATTRAALANADAVLLHLPGGAQAQPIPWAALSGVVTDAAVLAVTDEMDIATQNRLLASGVQDVVFQADAASLAQRSRLAAQRAQRDGETRKAYATDLGTGLPNRQQLVEHMSQIFALREREPRPVSVLVLRVDGLQGVEAGHGQEAANVVRRKLAVRLRAGVRASDVVASLGADLFAVLLPSMESADDAQHVVTKLMQSLREPVRVAGTHVPVAAHVGVAQFPQDGRQPDELLRHAATAAQSNALGSHEAAND